MLVFVFVSGHIVIAGNGISHIGSGLSVRDTMSGSSLQRLNTFDNNLTHIKNETNVQTDQKHFEIIPFCRSEIFFKPCIDIAAKSWADNPVTWKYCILWILNLWKIESKVQLAWKSNNSSSQLQQLQWKIGRRSDDIGSKTTKTNYSIIDFPTKICFSFKARRMKRIEDITFILDPVLLSWIGHVMDSCTHKSHKNIIPSSHSTVEHSGRHLCIK